MSNQLQPGAPCWVRVKSRWKDAMIVVSAPIGSQPGYIVDCGDTALHVEAHRVYQTHPAEYLGMNLHKLVQRNHIKRMRSEIHTALPVYLILCNLASSTGICSPSTMDIARKLGGSKQETVIRAISWLEYYGYISITRRSGAVNIYRICEL